MTEKYDLPIKFTEEERKAYAAWGIKKEKVMVPYVIIMIVVFTISIALVIMQVWKIRNTDSILFRVILDSDWMVNGCYTLAISMAAVILGPLNWFLDRIWKKPDGPKWIRIELREEGFSVKLLSGIEREEILAWERRNWQEAEEVMNPEDNTVLVQNCRMLIGENTIDSIYPEGKRHPWMDYPNRKVKGIDSVKKLCGILKGYQASIAERRLEQEWYEKELQNGRSIQ